MNPIMKEQMKKITIEELQEKARFIQIALPYDKRDDYNLINFDDGVMTELESDEDFRPPMLDDNTLLLVFMIDMKERRMLNWDYGEYIRIWAKVCDSGTYTLYDEHHTPLWQIKGYVPNKLIPPLEHGWGDYLELCVSDNGEVLNWPTYLDFSDFVEDGQKPEPVKSYRWHLVRRAFHRIMDLKLDEEEVSMLYKLLSLDDIRQRLITTKNQ